MTNRTSLAVLAVAGLIAATPVASTVFAAGTATETAAAPTAVVEEKSQILRTSDDIQRALTAVHAARVAIFNGAPDKAGNFAAEAVKDLKAAQATTGDLTVATTKSTEAGDSYLPFETSMSLAEGFEPTEEKVAKIEEANEHLVKGNEKKAAEILKGAEVDVVLNAALLPIEASVRRADEAAGLIAAGSYYEANLALKAIEDSAVVDTFAAATIPTQGKSS